MSEYDEAPHPADIAVVEDRQPAAVAQPILPVAELGHATAVETGRVLAETQARVIMAKQFPRSPDLNAEAAAMRTSVERIRKPFYNFPRGAKQVRGVTVEVMREAMRCYGNCSSGIAEQRRLGGMSEVMAWAWDMQGNVIEQATIYVPHERDRSEEKGGTVAVEGRDLQDIILAAASKRERELIKRILPKWYVQAAEDAAETALAGAPKDFDQTVEKTLAGFAQRGVTQKMLEERFGAPRQGWSRMHLVLMNQLGGEIQRGEVRVEAEFPELAAPDTSSAAATLAQAAGDKPAGEGKAKGGKPAKATKATEPEPVPPGTRIVELFDTIGVPNNQRARTVNALSGKDPAAEISAGQAAEVVRKLETCTEGTEDREVMKSRLAALIYAAEHPEGGEES